MLQRNGEESTFYSVISNPKINNRPIEDLEKVLRLIMMKIGLRAENWPSKEEKVILIDHIISNYGNHTIEEVRLAFDMAISYKLGLSDKEIVCYENFSCVYFSKIMNAYRSWASEIHKYVSNKSEVQLLEAPKTLTKEEWEEWLEDMLNYDFKLLPCTAYDYLVKEGRINPTVQEKHDYMSRAIAHLLAVIEPATKQFYDFVAMKKKGEYSAEVTATLVTISKRFAIYDYLHRAK